MYLKKYTTNKNTVYSTHLKLSHLKNIIMNTLRKIWSNQNVKRTIGLFLIIFGFIGIITPFTPWGILFFVGLELAGFHFLWVERIKEYIIELRNKYKKWK